MIVCALVSVTVPAVDPVTALRSAAAIDVESSLIVMFTLVSSPAAVVNPPAGFPSEARFAKESVIPLVNAAVTLFAPAILLATDTVTAPLTVAVVPAAAVTASVSNAAFNAAPSPVSV